MLEFTTEQFNLLKMESEKLYKSFGEVYCPYFKEKLSFDAQGLEHLKFKRREKSRPEKDQFMRLKLIHLAPEILKSSHTLQGILETKKFERVKTNNRWEHIQKNVTYFEFIAVIKRNRCKVVVKQIEGGKKFFWSIIPFWGMNEETKTRILHTGVPEED
jgi:hypothetical protein